MIPKYPPPTLNELPILILCPVERCNCRCRMCGYWHRNATATLNLEQVTQIALEAQELRVAHVVFSGGEPLLHPDIASMCASFRHIASHITILTNGLLVEQKAEQLITVCDEIIISLDGPREIHDDIRGVRGSFERIVEGIRAIRERSDTINISGRCTVQKRNFRHLRQTVDTAHALGLEKISFLAVSNDSDQFWNQAQSGEDENLIPDKQELPELEQELETLAIEYAEDYKNSFIAESPEKHQRSLLHYFSGLHGLRPFAPIYCNAPWYSAIIESNGDVRTCFFTDVVGNVLTDGGLKNVLNDKKAVDLRKSVMTNQIHQCARCVSKLHYKVSPTKTS